MVRKRVKIQEEIAFYCVRRSGIVMLWRGRPESNFPVSQKSGVRNKSHSFDSMALT